MMWTFSLRSITTYSVVVVAEYSVSSKSSEKGPTRLFKEPDRMRGDQFEVQFSCGTDIDLEMRLPQTAGKTRRDNGE